MNIYKVYYTKHEFRWLFANNISEIPSSYRIEEYIFTPYNGSRCQPLKLNKTICQTG